MAYAPEKYGIVLQKEVGPLAKGPREVGKYGHPVAKLVASMTRMTIHISSPLESQLLVAMLIHYMLYIYGKDIQLMHTFLLYFFAYIIL